MFIGDNDGGHQQLNVSSSYASGTGQKSTNERTAKRNTNKNCDSPPWDDLPVELLATILKGVNIADYYSFGRVSTNWRNAAVSSKREFVESKGPLVAQISSRARRTCFFYDVSARIAYRASIPKFCGRFCAGISCGFLIMRSYATDLMLANPLTEQLVEFPKLTQLSNNHMMMTDSCILAYTNPQPDFLAVVLSPTSSSIQFRRSRDNEWSFFSFAGKPWKIRDIIAFGSRIYALADDSQIGVLSLRSPPTVEFLNLKDKPFFSPAVKLVASGDDLLAVDFVAGRRIRIYRVDIAGSQWVRVHDLGDKSVFLTDLKSSRICSTTSWGGRPNCVYHLGYVSAECLVFSVANPFVAVDRFQITPGNRGHASRVQYAWYLPSDSYTMDIVRDDQFDDAVA